MSMIITLGWVANGVINGGAYGTLFGFIGEVSKRALWLIAGIALGVLVAAVIFGDLTATQAITGGTPGWYWVGFMPGAIVGNLLGWVVAMVLGVSD
jgi:hypothetical protein